MADTQALPPRLLAPLPCLGGPYEGRLVPYQGRLDITLVRHGPFNGAEALREEANAPLVPRCQYAHYTLVLEPAGAWVYLHTGTDEPGSD